MNTRLLAAATTAAFGLVGFLFATPANACSYTDLRQALTAGSTAAKNAARFAAGVNAAGLAIGAGAATAPALSANGSHPNAPIVGYWKFTFTAPDGESVVDWGFQQWHDDGTELTNSGGQLPATGNFCTGVWKQRGGSYQLNHWAIAWNLPGTDPSDLAGLINIRETVDVDPTGRNMTGTFSLDMYDTDGTTFEAHLVDGTVTATRITP